MENISGDFFCSFLQEEGRIEGTELEREEQEFAGPSFCSMLFPPEAAHNYDDDFGEPPLEEGKEGKQPHSLILQKDLVKFQPEFQVSREFPVPSNVRTPPVSHSAPNSNYLPSTTMSSCMLSREGRSTISTLRKSRKSKRPEMEEDNSVGSEYKKEDELKQRKLERNRKCARESRKRKKEYLRKLELQVEQLQEELEYYKAELARCTSTGATPRVQEPVDVSKQFQKAKEDPAKIQAFLNQLWEHYGTYCDKRRSQVDEHLENLKTTLIPPLHSLVLSSAMFSQGLFCPSGTKKPQNILHSSLKLTKSELSELNQSQSIIVQLGVRLKNELELLEGAKQRAEDILKKLDGLLFEKIYMHLSIDSIFRLLEALEKTKAGTGHQSFAHATVQCHPVLPVSSPKEMYSLDEVDSNQEDSFLGNSFFS